MEKKLKKNKFKKKQVLGKMVNLKNGMTYKTIKIIILIMIMITKKIKMKNKMKIQLLKIDIILFIIKFKLN